MIINKYNSIIILFVALINSLLICTFIENLCFLLAIYLVILIFIIIVFRVNNIFKLIKIFLITRIFCEISSSLFSLNLNIIWGITLLFIECIYFLRMKRQKRDLYLEIIVIFIYFCSFSLLLNSFNKISIYGFVYLVKILSWSLLIPITINEKFDILLLSKFFYKIFYINVFLALVQKFIYPAKTFRYNINEINAYYETPQAFAFSMLFILPFIYYLYFIENRLFQKLLYFISIVIGYLLIFNSYTRTALVGVLVQVIMLFILNNRINIFNKLIIFTSILVGFLTMASTNILSKIEIFSRIINMNKENINEFSSGRIDIYIANIRYFMDGSLFNKFFGNGFGSSFEASEKYLGLSILAHNDYLDLLLDVGVIGLGLFIVFIVVLYKMISTKKMKYTNYSLYMLNIANISTMLACAFFNPIITGQFLTSFSLLIGSSLTYSKLNESNIGYTGVSKT